MSHFQITIPDIPLDTFLCFLEYLYTDDVPIEKGNPLGILKLANRWEGSAYAANFATHSSTNIVCVGYLGLWCIYSI